MLGGHRRAPRGRAAPALVPGVPGGSHLVTSSWQTWPGRAWQRLHPASAAAEEPGGLLISKHVYLEAERKLPARAGVGFLTVFDFPAFISFALVLNIVYLPECAPASSLRNPPSPRVSLSLWHAGPRFCVPRAQVGPSGAALAPQLVADPSWGP